MPDDVIVSLDKIRAHVLQLASYNTYARILSKLTKAQSDQKTTSFKRSLTGLQVIQYISNVFVCFNG